MPPHLSPTVPESEEETPKAESSRPAALPLPLPSAFGEAMSGTDEHTHQSRLSGLHGHLSRIQPDTPVALRTALYQTPQAIATLRKEAAERYLAWACSQPRLLNSDAVQGKGKAKASVFDKARWEAEIGMASLPVARSVTTSDDERGDDMIRASMATVRAKQGRGDGGARGSVLRGVGVAAKSSGRGRGMERRRTITASMQTRPAFASMNPTSPLSPKSSTSPPMKNRRRQAQGQQSKTPTNHSLANSENIAASVNGQPTGTAVHHGFLTFDPLHLPSLLRLAFEGLLLGPLRLRLARLFTLRQSSEPVPSHQLYTAPAELAEREDYFAGSEGYAVRTWEREVETNVRDVEDRWAIPTAALIAGAFCAGVSVGVVLAHNRSLSGI